MPVRNRRDLSAQLERTMRKTYQKLKDSQEFEVEENLVKTYVVESNREAVPLSLRHRGFDVDLIATQDETLTILRVMGKEGGATFYLDTADPRFWLMHTGGPSTTTDSFVRGLVGMPGNWIDSLWIPGERLESFVDGGKLRSFSVKYRNEIDRDEPEEVPVKEMSMRLWGSEAPIVLRALRRSGELQRSVALSNVGVKVAVGDADFVLDDIHYSGKFTTRGTSFGAHYQLVSRVLDGYKDLLNAIESSAISIVATDSGGSLSGEPISIRFSRAIEDLEKFLGSLLASEAPFRLWGTYDEIWPGFAKVWAVDLHTGHKLNLEVMKDQIRVYLPVGSCGNAVIRLYTNLQHSYDSSVTLRIPEDARNLEPHASC